MTVIRPIATVLTLLLTTSATVAQSDPEPVELTPATDYEPQLVDLRVVDQGVEDIGALNESLRSFSPGLHQPNDFSRVYQMPGSGSFMRAQGALFAVYDQGVYAAGGAVIPAGTVFYIGLPSPYENLPGDPNGPVPQMVTEISGEPLRWDTRIDAADSTTVPETPIANDPLSQLEPQFEHSTTLRPGLRHPDDTQHQPVTDAIAPDIIEIRDYRQRRLTELMRRAAQAALRNSKE